MNRSALLRLILIAVAAALAGALIAVAIMRPRAKESDEAEAKPVQRVSVENGEPTITLDAETQKKIGLATTRLQGSQQSEQLQLLGTVVDVQELAALQNQEATARAQAEQARAKAAFDRAELARLKTLNADNRAVSDRAVQEASASVAADDAAIAAANAAIRNASNAVAQRFGPVIASALESHAPLFESLVSLRQVMVQLALPPGTPAPQSVTVAASDGSSATARLVSPAPRVDPRLQGASFFYVAPRGNFSAGMNVTAHYAGQHAAGGVIVPSDAVVSFQGKAWVYVRRQPTKFARREVSTALPVAGGFFVTDLAPETEVVTAGAQQLLSEEMRAQLHEE